MTAAPYGTNDEADEYHAARGNIEWAAVETLEEKTSARLVASDYVDLVYGSQFGGTKVGLRNQERLSPRINWYDRDGYIMPSTEDPRELRYAVYELALRHIQQPGILSPDFNPADVILKARVEGAVSVEFADGGSNAAGQMVFTIVDNIIAPILTGDGAGFSALSGRTARV